MSHRDEYIAQMKQRLDAWNTEINALEVRGHEIKEDAKETYQEQLAVLHAKRAEGEKKIEQMREAGDNTWEQIKAESENIWEALKDSVTAFRAHFK